MVECGIRFAKAVRAATEWEIDSISMSWTIEKTDRNGDDIIEPEEVISRAAAQNILMFCAATDQGAYKDLTYPAATSTKDIFKIGAAEASGTALKWAGDQSLVDCLAAVILYCVQLEGIWRGGGPAMELRDYRSLKNHERMNEVFRQIGTTKESEGKYIRVWNRFTRFVKKAENESVGKDKYIEYVGELASELAREP